MRFAIIASTPKYPDSDEFILFFFSSYEYETHRTENSVTLWYEVADYDYDLFIYYYRYEFHYASIL